MRGTHLYAQETNLTRRVTAWEDKLLPVLRDQHSRPRFDIHDYGTRLLETLSIEVAKNVVAEQELQRKKQEEEEEGGEGWEEGQALSADGMTGEADEVRPKADVLSEAFVAIAAKQQASRYEVCRLFLSMLQLANDRNVELSHETANSEGMEDLPSLDAVADRLTDSLRVKLLSMAKAVDMGEHPGVDHSSEALDNDDDAELPFVTQATQEQGFGPIQEQVQGPIKGKHGSSNSNSNNNNRKGGDSGVGAFVFDEGLAQGSSSSGRNGGVMAEPAQRKASKKRSAMSDLMNRGGASLGSRF
jgi:hypothetical protein